MESENGGETQEVGGPIADKAVAESTGNSNVNMKTEKKKYWITAAVGGVMSLILAVFLFLDWRVRDVCKWSRFEKNPQFSKRVDLISSIFEKDLYHFYFVQDYRDYSSKKKLLEDVDRNQKEIVKQLKKAGFQDDEIEISPMGRIYKYKGPTPWSKKSELFGMNGIAIDVKTKNQKLYKLISSSGVTISRHPKAGADVQILWLPKTSAGHSIHRSSRNVFSFSITNSLLKALDCTRIHIEHTTLIEEKHSKK